MDGFDLYFEWLLKRANIGAEDGDYSLLCSVMFETPFYPIVKEDENRCSDGIQLRKDFEGDVPDTAECTILEMIFSIAERMGFITEESDYDIGLSGWFSVILRNLGLDRCTNLYMLSRNDAYYEVKDILKNLNFRRYGPDGRGGMFPLREPASDQRNEEILVQMNEYLNENCPFV